MVKNLYKREDKEKAFCKLWENNLRNLNYVDEVLRVAKERYSANSKEGRVLIEATDRIKDAKFWNGYICWISNREFGLNQDKSMADYEKMANPAAGYGAVEAPEWDGLLRMISRLRNSTLGVKVIYREFFKTRNSLKEKMLVLMDEYDEDIREACHIAEEAF